MAVLNPHFGTTVIDTSGVPRTQTSAVWDIGKSANASWWQQTVAPTIYGNGDWWQFCGPSEWDAFKARVLMSGSLGGTPAPWNFNEVAAARAAAEAFLSGGGWTPGSSSSTAIGTFANYQDGIDNGQIYVRFYYAGFFSWFDQKAGLSTAGRYDAAIANTLRAVINNSNNDPLAYPGQTASTISIFHPAEPWQFILQVAIWCGKRLLSASEFLQLCTRLRRTYWRIALDYYFHHVGADVGSGHGNGVYGTSGDPSATVKGMTAAISLEPAVSGQYRHLVVVNDGGWVRKYPSRWFQSNSHVAGNQAHQPMHAAALCALWLGDDKLLAETLRMQAVAFAYTMTREGYGFDMFRLSEQLGYGVDHGGSGYFVEILALMATQYAVMHRQGKASPLEWTFDTGMPDVSGFPGSATTPASGQTKSPLLPYQFVRDATGGIVTVYGDSPGSIPQARMRYPVRFADGVTGAGAEGQWIQPLVLMHQMRPGDSFDKAVRRAAPYNQGLNATDLYGAGYTGQFNPVWGNGVVCGHSPAIPFPGLMHRNAILTGTTDYEARAGYAVFGSGAVTTPGVTSIDAVSTTPGSLAWSFTVSTVGGGTVTLINQSPGDPQGDVVIADFASGGQQTISRSGPDGEWILRVVDKASGNAVKESAKFALSSPYIDAGAAPQVSGTSLVLAGHSFAHSTLQGLLMEITSAGLYTGVEFSVAITISGNAQAVQTISASIPLASLTSGKFYVFAVWDPSVGASKPTNANSNNASVSTAMYQFVASAPPPPAPAPTPPSPSPTPSPPPPAPAPTPPGPITITRGMHTVVMSTWQMPAPSLALIVSGTTNATSITARISSTYGMTGDDYDHVVPITLNPSGSWSINTTVPPGDWWLLLTNEYGDTVRAGRFTAASTAYATDWVTNPSGARPALFAGTYGLDQVSVNLLNISTNQTIPCAVSYVDGDGNPEPDAHVARVVRAVPTVDVLAPGSYRWQVYNIGGSSQPQLSDVTWSLKTADDASIKDVPTGATTAQILVMLMQMRNVIDATITRLGN